MTLLYTTYTTLNTPPQMQLQLHYTNYTTPQLQLHYTTATNTAALHHTTSSSCGWGGRPGDHCNHCSHSKEHSSNHLSVHQWIRSATRDSQQPSSPIGFLFWNFRHRLVWHYWKHIGLHPTLSYNSDNIFGYNFSPSAWHDPYVRNTTARIWTGSRGPGWIGSVPLPPAIACHGVQGFPQTGHGWQLGGERLVAVTWNMGPGSLSIPKSRNPKHVERQLFEKFGYVSKIRETSALLVFFSKNGLWNCVSNFWNDQWTVKIVPRKHDLITVGFFSTNVIDAVICFHPCSFFGWVEGLQVAMFDAWFLFSQCCENVSVNETYGFIQVTWLYY